MFMQHPFHLRCRYTKHQRRQPFLKDGRRLHPVESTLQGFEAEDTDDVVDGEHDPRNHRRKTEPPWQVRNVLTDKRR